MAGHRVRKTEADLTRGALDHAEAMHRRSLAIDDKLGRLEGMANQDGKPESVLPTIAAALAPLPTPSLSWINVCFYVANAIVCIGYV